MAPWLVGLAFLLLYARTAAPSIVELFDDTLEFQMVLPTFGIAHPTGYPLFTLAGGAWSRLLPVGNWAWRTNLFSAVCAAAAVAILFVLTRRLVGRDAGGRANWSGLAAALIFGLGPVWWMQATVAEVYALHNLLAVAILLVAVGLPESSRTHIRPAHGAAVAAGRPGSGTPSHHGAAAAWPGNLPAVEHPRRVAAAPGVAAVAGRAAGAAAALPLHSAARRPPA